jgi:hypothetical protein
MLEERRWCRDWGEGSSGARSKTGGLVCSEKAKELQRREENRLAKDEDSLANEERSYRGTGSQEDHKTSLSGMNGQTG